MSWIEGLKEAAPPIIGILGAFSGIITVVYATILRKAKLGIEVKDIRHTLSVHKKDNPEDYDLGPPYTKFKVDILATNEGSVMTTITDIELEIKEGKCNLTEYLKDIDVMPNASKRLKKEFRIYKYLNTKQIPCTLRITHSSGVVGNIETYSRPSK